MLNSASLAHPCRKCHPPPGFCRSFHDCRCTVHHGPGRHFAEPADPRGLHAAVFLSALLLFSVQPLFTKMVLPRLGGSPAVWSVAMVFFQSLLLAGYAYAHYLTKASNRVVPVVVHLGLLAV